jgi:tetratricopeptide (TPR) repeat protein
VVLWAQVLTGLELDPDGVVRTLDSPAWTQRRDQLAQQARVLTRRENLGAWHWSEAQAAESREQWFAVQWHLRPLIKAQPGDAKLRARLGRALTHLGRWKEAGDQLSKAIKEGEADLESRFNRGVARTMLGQWDPAVADLSYIINREPNSWRAWFQRGSVFILQKEWYKGLKDITKVIELEPGLARAWHTRGFIHVQQGRWDKASTDFAKAARLNWAAPQMWSDHALVRLRLCDGAGYRQACSGMLDHFASTKDPDVAAALAWTCALGPNGAPQTKEVIQLLLGFQGADKKDHSTRGNDSALDFKYRWFKASPFGLSLARQLGFAFYRAGQFDQAVDRLKLALAFRKHDPAAWLFLAMCYHRKGHPVEAAKWLDKATQWIDQPTGKEPAEPTHEDRPSWVRLPWNERLALQLLRGEAEGLLRKLGVENDADHWFQQGKEHARLRHWDQAIAALSKAINQEPELPLYWNYRGFCYFRKGQWAKAVADFSKAIERDPNDPALWTNRGDTLGKLRQWDKAIGDFSKAIELKANYEIAWYLRGSAHASLGRWDKASDDLAKAGAFQKVFLSAWSDYALVRLQLKDSDGYRKACARLLKKGSDIEDRDALAFIVWTCCIAPDAGANLERVVQALEKAKQKGSSEDRYPYLPALGAGLYRAGKFEAAVKRLDEAMGSRKQPVPSTWFFLAMAHHRLGNKDKAKKWFDKASTWIKQQRQKKGDGNPNNLVSWESLPWKERLMLELLHREARALLKTPKKADGGNSDPGKKS